MDICIKSECEDGSRSLIIEDNGSSAWAYLVDMRSGKLIKDAFLYSPIDPRDRLNEDEIADGTPPVLIKQYASDSAVIVNASEELFGILWSFDGNSAVILYDRKPISAIYESEQRGFSKALSIESGFGNPWSKELFDEFHETYC